MWFINKDKEEEMIKSIVKAHYEETHKKCAWCGIVGHKVDMIVNVLGYGFYDYYHKDCYAKAFNKHLCECGCGKWVDNKKGGK